MRRLEEVKEFLDEKGFEYEVHTPGQSYRNGGVMFFWKGNKPEYFKPVIRGKCKDGRRVIDLVRLFPIDKESANEVWKFEPYYSTRKFQDEMVWEGRFFKRWEGVKIVKLPEIKNDLEELISN